MIPTMWRDRLPYNDAAYDPVWAACAEAGLPVHTHSGEAPMEEYGDNTGVYLAEVVWWAARPAWHLLFGGAFERFPDLKFVVTEAAAYWAPDMMWKWDQYMGGGHTTKKLAAMLKGKISKLPSDYFGTNIFIGASTMSKEEIRRRYVIGTDVVMWGTDYPHPEGTWPHTAAKLRADFAEVPVDDTAELLGLTAARVYGFDLDELRPIASRIGPTPELARPGPHPAQRPGGAGPARWWKAEYGVQPRPGLTSVERAAAVGAATVARSAVPARSPGAQHLVAVEGVAGRVGRVVLDRERGGHLGHGRPDAVADRAQGLEVEAVDARPRCPRPSASSRPGRSRRRRPGGPACCRGRTPRCGGSPTPHMIRSTPTSWRTADSLARRKLAPT